MADFHFDLDEFISKDPAQLIKEINNAPFFPRGKPKPAIRHPIGPFVVEKPAVRHMVDRPYRQRDSDDYPDDPNLEEPPTAAPSRDISEIHDTLDRDYVYTNEHGFAPGMEHMGKAGIPNQEESFPSPVPVFPVTTPVPLEDDTPQAELRGGSQRASIRPDLKDITGLADNVYRGQVVTDRMGREWTVVSFSVTGNEVNLCNDRNYKTKIPLHVFRGIPAPACPFQVGDKVLYSDRNSGEATYEVKDITEESQRVWLEIGGKRRSIKFASLQLAPQEEVHP